MKRFLFFITILILNTQLFSQDVFWASKVDTVSSQYSQTRYGANQVLGVPNVDVQGRLSPYAWSVEPNEIDKEIVEIAYIEVSYEDTCIANQIAVFESYNPGSVSLIYYSPYKTGDNNWKLVYADTAVISRSGLPDFQAQDQTLRDVAGTRNRKLKLFSPDSAFLPPAYHNVINVFLKFPERIQRVRVVINPLAVDGWNQIDAIGISAKKDSIKFPKPIIVDQSLIIEPNSTNLGTNINTDKAEIAPIISPDGKRIYYSKRKFIKKANTWTQNIWYSDLISQKKYACNPTRRHNFKNIDVWQNGEPTYLNFNTIVPHTIVGFSAKGDYMYISGLYEDIQDCNCQDVFKKNTSGLSVSKLDSTLFETPDQAKLDLLDSVERLKYHNYQIYNEILVSSKFDSISNKNKFFVRVYDDSREGEWSEPFYLGTYSDAPFSFNTLITARDTGRYWISADSLSADSSQFAALKWSTPTTVQIENFTNSSNYVNFFIVPDGKHMLLSIEDSTNTKGQRDIYISELKANNIWSKPKPLSDNINTVGDEDSPFLDGDMTTLYFSSTGHNTFGEHDVFVSYMIDNDWTQWTTPLNLGSRVNSPSDDVNFKIDQKTRRAYFASYEFGNGCDDKTDIFSIMMGKPITIYIHGITKNANDYNNPIEDAKVALSAIDGTNPNGIRSIDFYSGVNGKFNIKITKMVEANKMTRFALKTSKDQYHQCDSLGNKLDYLYLDLSNPDWIVDIDTNLFLLGPKYNYANGRNTDYGKTKHPDITGSDSVVYIIDTVYRDRYITTKFKGKIDVDTNQGCPIFYYAGKLYNIATSSNNEEGRILEVPVKYIQYFDYNQKDVSINEKNINTLTNELFNFLDNNPNASVYIQSSASQVPTTKYCSNFELARMRANSVEERLIMELQKHGYDLTRVSFDKRYIVEGKYDNDPANRDKYKEYQYVKVWIYSCEEHSQVQD